MKKKEFTEFKNKSVKELQKFVTDKKTEMAKKKVEIFSGKEKNLKYFNNLRRDVAKVMTVIREQEKTQK
ncbi:MAG TPA: 50S ribosomal protein L29 [Alphaproteobacteria bacterium]|jgi:ribosomal protein L29|nr:50S ribosomal protein L29 [Alphaproteobacteria bacterium]